MIERLLVIGVVLALGTLVLYSWELGRGSGIDKARTEALTVMVFYQLFNVFNARSETRSAFTMNPLSNPFLFFSIVASVIAQFAVIYWAPLQYVFRTVPLQQMDWLVILPVAFTVILVVEIEKAVRRFLAKK
jgi:Ca2+-transporting ATPase